MVVVFADVDMFYDAFALGRDQLTGGMIALNSNLPMFLNAVELLSGGGNLLAVRSRAATQRPFTKIDEMRDDVEMKYRPELEKLQSEADAVAQQIGALKLTTDQSGQNLVLDPAQQKQMEELMSKQVDFSKKLRELRKQQNKDIDRTKSWLMALNILAMPLLVIVIGGIMALIRRSSTAAH